MIVDKEMIDHEWYHGIVWRCGNPGETRTLQWNAHSRSFHGTTEAPFSARTWHELAGCCFEPVEHSPGGPL